MEPPTKNDDLGLPLIMTADVAEAAYEEFSLVARQLSVSRAQTVVGDVEGARAMAAGFALEAPPEGGAALGEILEIAREALSGRIDTGHPGYLAHIPSYGLLTAAMAEFLALAANPYATVYAAAPAVAEMEATVIRWFAQILGLPSSAGGCLTSGGSIANLIALHTARTIRADPSGEQLTFYASRETHPSVERASAIAGLARCEDVSDGEGLIDPQLLRRRIRADRRFGRRPFLVVATAGYTTTGYVDDLAAIASVASEEDCWLHVDAAYGGFFALTSAGGEALTGIELADSVTLDPHKSLFLPYGTGSLLVRDRNHLSSTFAIGASYLPPLGSSPLELDTTAISPELSREARGLRVWLPLKIHGLARFRASLDLCLERTAVLCGAIERLAFAEVVTRPSLSVFTFRLLFETLSPDLAATAQAVAIDHIQRSGEWYVSSVRIGSVTAIRVCVLHPRPCDSAPSVFVEAVTNAYLAASSQMTP